jgi:hypothetical protein
MTIQKIMQNQFSMEDHTKDYTKSPIDQSLKNFIIGLKFGVEINKDEILKNIGEHEKKK